MLILLFRWRHDQFHKEKCMHKLGLALGLILVLVSTGFAKEVNVVMKDQTLVKGELVGISDGVIYLKAAEGRTEQIKTENVTSVFDAATGEKIETGVPAAAPTKASDAQNSGSVPPSETPASTASTAAAPRPVKPLLFIFGTLDSGLVAYSPCKPLEGVYQPGSAYVVGTQPYDLAWGAGMGLEYRFMGSFAGSLDFGISRWEKLLAKANGYGVGDWVWEQSGYTDARVGPFPMDVKYYMDTTSVRLGGKYYPIEGVFQPFVGLSLGMYAWQAIIGNREEEKKYSEISSGTAFSPTYQLGIDFVLDGFVVRIFGDLATAVANPKFEDLFQPGWTFESVGGEHVQGPYRFGLAVAMEI
jgi:hypothetical protein